MNIKFIKQVSILGSFDQSKNLCFATGDEFFPESCGNIGEGGDEFFRQSFLLLGFLFGAVRLTELMSAFVFFLFDFFATIAGGSIDTD